MKKVDVSNPLVLSKIIASEGLANQIPANASSITEQYNASQDVGFPAITMKPVSAGGEAPDGRDFNGFLELLSSHIFASQNGGIYTFNADVSTAIGGYPQGAILSYVDETGEFHLVKSVIDDNTYNFVSNPEYIDDEKWSEIQLGGGAGGASDKIGSIIALFASSTYTPDGCLSCDGTEYNKSDYSVFFTTYLAGGKLATCTYEEYESDITTYGQCAKFALDTTNEKFKVPTIKDGSYLTQALSDTEIGKAYNESLPNITGAISCGVVSQPYQEGALYKEEQKPGFDGSYAGSDSDMTRLMFNASRSSSTYQDGAKVQGDNVRIRFFVVVSNNEELDVPEINQIEFNNPFFFGDYKWSEINIENSSWLRSDATFHSGSTYADFYNWILLNKNNQIDSGISVKGSDETYDDYDYVVNKTDGTFRLPLSVKGASGSAVAGNGKVLGLFNGTTYAGLKANSNDGLEDSAGLYGENVGVTNATGGQMINLTGVGITTDPTKSGIETSSTGLSLYFYVGETLQKTNVIDISKLQKEVDNLIFNNKSVIQGYEDLDYANTEETITTLPYTATQRGLISVSALTYASSVNMQIMINGKTVSRITTSGSSNTYCLDFQGRVSAGDVVSVSGVSVITTTFIPLKEDSVKSLSKVQIQTVNSMPEHPEDGVLYLVLDEKEGE